MCSKEDSCLSDDVLSYLIEHGDAQDTLEGIVEWWLMEQSIVTRTAQVREALDDLVAAGLLLERRSQDSRTHYRINRHKTEEIVARIARRS
jgi:Fe2+ or Zn2+ uptake regulation protein